MSSTCEKYVSFSSIPGGGKVRTDRHAFHWPVEFPEVFFAERPDPLDAGANNRVAMMDMFIGNPPFAGKNTIATLGAGYLPWLQTLHVGAHGNADLAAHFFRRASALLGRHGAIGFIATNTIAQGDTRQAGLQPLVTQEGCAIYDAIRSMEWPTDDANVSVSVVHLAKGLLRGLIDEAHLDHRVVAQIDSRLRPKVERPDPVPLKENEDLSFQGSNVLGIGFTLEPDERTELVRSDARNQDRIFPYLGGDEVNTSPTQNFDRYIINFGQMKLEGARAWPELLAILEERVKPGRDKVGYCRAAWWQYERSRVELYEAIAPLKRCLVCGIVAKHLMFSFQPTNRVFSHKLYVFPFDDFAHFAALQSRTHLTWAVLLSSTMRDAGTNYSASDCFDTFPFPNLSKALGEVGRAFYEERAAFMLNRQVGLTVTYNRMKDRDCRDIEILRLRELSEAMDRAVLQAYAWGDIIVPPFEAASDDDERKAFEDEVIDRLFALNAERAKTPLVQKRHSSTE